MSPFGYFIFGAMRIGLLSSFLQPATNNDAIIKTKNSESIFTFILELLIYL